MNLIYLPIHAILEYSEEMAQNPIHTKLNRTRL